ncbi:LysR family transcriptional regulator substrate-binding protein [Streptomyces sp.]|uniref:LysR family transcriptional regulator substrate-binding protein n=1 Tax=Streptomyces sp. TaxID=1931 RepID=UPI0025F7E6D6|nr:LysR family transcriptional regulator substrate-binding protein [Streptomyces sp.]
MPGARSLSRLIDDRFTSVGGSPTTVISVPTVQTAVALVAAGLGVSVLSDEMAEHHPGVDRVPVAGGRPELPPGLVRRQDGIVTPVGERFAGLFGTDETGEWAG